MSNKNFTKEEKIIMQVASEISIKILDYLSKIQPYHTDKHKETFDVLTDQGNILFFGKIINNFVAPIVQHLSANTNYSTTEILNLIDCNLRKILEINSDLN